MTLVGNGAFHRRPYQAVLSCADADRDAIDRIHAWLTGIVGMPICYNEAQVTQESRVLSAPADGISNSRAAILVLSRASVQSGRLAEEYKAALVQRRFHPGFRVVAIRLQGAGVPTFMRGTKLVELTDGKLGIHQAAELLAGLDGMYQDTPDVMARDVFVSRTWPESGASQADWVCRMVASCGFRLIGDSKEQEGFSHEDRVRSLIDSCGAFVAILPDRGGRTTLPSIVRAADYAHDRGIPSLLLADAEVEELPPSARSDVVRLPPDPSEQHTLKLRQAIDRLDEDWQQPRAPHRIFFSASLDSGVRERNRRVQQTLEHATRMPSVVGEDLRVGHIQSAIVDSIRGAFLVVADISGENLNTSIEAGIALGAGRRLHLVAAGPRRRPAFMFRDQQVWYFDDDIELLGLVHRIGRPYRRRVLNEEIRPRMTTQDAPEHRVATK